MSLLCSFGFHVWEENSNSKIRIRICKKCEKFQKKSIRNGLIEWSDK